MQNGRGTGKHGDVLWLGGESRIGDGDGVFAERNGVEMELARRVGMRGLREFRIARFENHGYVGNGAVLWIVNNTAHRAKNGGQSTYSKEKKNTE